MSWSIAEADPENSEREGRVPHPPPPRRMKTSLFRSCSNKVTLTFQKHIENTRKKGGRCPLGPSPKSAYELKARYRLTSIVWHIECSGQKLIEVSCIFEVDRRPVSWFSSSSQAITLGERERVHAKVKFRWKLNPDALLTSFHILSRTIFSWIRVISKHF